MVNVALLGLDVVLGVTVNVRVPTPVVLAGRNHEGFPTTDHEHCGGVMVTEPGPPSEPTVMLAGSSVNAPHDELKFAVMFFGESIVMFNGFVVLLPPGTSPVQFTNVELGVAVIVTVVPGA